MIRKLLFGTIFAFLIILSSSIVTAPIWYGSGDDTGLVGKWSCEGNFLDSSGQGNNGTQSGGVTITDGYKGRGCGFDGVNDYIEKSSMTFINVSNNWTTSVWFKINGATPNHYGYIFDYADSNALNRIAYSLGASDNTLRVISASTAVYTSGTLNYGQWYHFAYSYNGTTWSTYQDGVLINYTQMAKGSAVAANYLSLGKSILITTYPFNGSIDEVRIYNRSLSADEISALYNTSKTYKFMLKSTPTLGGLNDTPAPMLTDETGLVGHWKLDGDATDSSGLGYDGTVTGATATNNGRWDRAYSFDGSGDYITTNLDINTTVSNNISLCGWIYFDAYPDVEKRILSACITPTIRLYLYPPNYLLFDVYNITNQRAQASTTMNLTRKWHHVCGIRNETLAQLYVDGASVSTANIYGLGLDATGGFIITSTGTTSINGTIDEVRVYNRTLSADEVKELYLSKGLVGYWKMDASTRNTTDTYDSSGYNNDGKISGAALTNEGRFKEGYKFDGVNDYINCGDTTSTNITEDEVTVSAWIKSDSDDQDDFARIVTKINSTYHESFQLLFNQTNGIYFTVRNNSAQASTSTLTLNSRTWYHIAGVYNSTKIILYLNGIPRVSASLTGNLTSKNKCVIGASTYTGGDSFNGTIDEVRIYNRALSASEVAGLYNGTKSNYLILRSTPTLGLLNDTPAPTVSDETGLVGHWKLDGDATDYSGQGNDGVVTGATITNNGRWDRAYDFNGINPNFINLSDPAAYDFGANNFTVTAWGKFAKVPLPPAGWQNVIVSKWNTGASTGTNEWSLTMGYSATNDTRPSFGIENGTTTYSARSTEYLDANWHFIAGLRNGTSVYVYVDGLPKGSANISDKAANNVGREVYIGRILQGSTFNGTIDEVRIYNRSLSPEEIQELYLSKGLVGHWKMDADQKNSTSTFDSSGYNNHGIITGAVLTNEGRFKEGYRFATYGNNINLGRPTSLNISNGTVSMWFKPTTSFSGAPGTQKHMMKGGPSYFYFSGVTSKLLYYLSNGTNAVSSDSESWDTKWYHMAVTYNGSFAAMYVDGKQQAGTVSISGQKLFAFSNSVMIGNDGYTANNTIDEVRIYNRALSSAEVGQLYNGTKSNYLIMRSVAG